MEFRQSTITTTYFPNDLSKIAVEHEHVLNGSVKHVVKIYEFVFDQYDASNKHEEYVPNLIGEYRDGRPVKVVSKEIIGTLLSSNLPNEIKQALSLEEKTNNP